MYEIHTRQLPGRPRAAILTAGGLLVLCLALAAQLASSRGLGEPVQPPGWAISFQPPRGWISEGLTADDGSETITYLDRSARRTARRFSMTRRLARADRTPVDLCFAEVSRLVGGFQSLQVFQRFGPPKQAALGPLSGARKIIPQAAYVHVGLLSRRGGAGELYVLELLSPKPSPMGEVLAAAVRPAE
ncbi:MAG: hypothetical protein ACYSVY_21085 [Planctomycetota bacterium]|jgi:hypothetical protein